MKTNKVNCLLIISILIFSMGLRATESTINGSNQTILPSYPSKITPFNISTTLYWTPTMIDNSEGNPGIPFNPMPYYPLAVNGSFGPLQGENLPVYSTLLPLAPHISSLYYSLQITDLQGPSNVSLSIGVYFYENGYRVINGNYIVLNSTLNTKTSGYLTISNQPSYANVMKNIARNWEYSTITVQPISNNKSQAWNHTLTITARFTGSEDRAFFNYERTQKGYQPWPASYFTPITYPAPNITDKPDQYFDIQPKSQPDLIQQSPISLVYLNNQSDFTNKLIEMNLWVYSNQNLDMEILLTKFLLLHNNRLESGIYSSESGISNIYTLTIPIIKGANDIQIQIPWQKMNKLNYTTFLSNKTETRTFLITQGNNTGYDLFDAINLVYASLQKDWNASVTTKVHLKTLKTDNLPENTMNLTLNGKNYLITYGVNKTTYDLASQLSHEKLMHEFVVVGSTILVVGILAGGMFVLVEYRSYTKKKQTSNKLHSFKGYLIRKIKRKK